MLATCITRLSHRFPHPSMAAPLSCFKLPTIFLYYEAIRGAPKNFFPERVLGVLRLLRSHLLLEKQLEGRFLLVIILSSKELPKLDGIVCVGRVERW